MDGWDYLGVDVCVDNIETHLWMGNKMDNAGYGMQWKWTKTMTGRSWPWVRLWIWSMDCVYGCIWILDILWIRDDLAHIRITKPNTDPYLISLSRRKTFTQLL